MYRIGLSPIASRGWRSQAQRDIDNARLAAEEQAARAAASAPPEAEPPPVLPQAQDDRGVEAGGGEDSPLHLNEPKGGELDPVDPPQDGEVAAAPAADGGDSPPGAAVAANPDHHPADGPPPRAGEDPEPLEPEPPEPELHELVVAWLNEHWDIVAAMARAGQAPQRPSPAPGATPGTLAREAQAEPPYVEPEDRWTKWKMAEFLRHLAATQNISASAKAVGMSRNSAYKLRTRLKGQPFDVAWEAAFRHGYDNLAHSALELALDGEEVPHYYKGELVATHRKRHPQLIVQLLNMRNRAGAPMLGRYGAAAEFWSEDWDRMTERVETGSATWSDEQDALGPQERAALALPDARQAVARIIERNQPDDPAKGRSRP
jgi:hypothetical protein